MRWTWMILIAVNLLVTGCGPSRAKPRPEAMAARDRSRHGVVAVTWPGLGRYLIMADTFDKKLRVYRLVGGDIRLVAVRSYLYDLKVGATPRAKAGGFSYEQIRALAKKRLTEAELREPPRGRELVLTTGDEAGGPARIILINSEEKRILTYRLMVGSLLLVGARPYVYDEALLHTKSGRPQGYSYDETKKMVESATRKGAPIPEIPHEHRATKIEGLIEQLEHRLSSVRTAAARDLDRIEPPAIEARKALQKALTDKSTSVRKAAAQALKSIRAAQAGE